MRWQGGRRSTNVEDYRGRGIGGGLKFGGGAVIAMIIAYFLGVDPRLIMSLFSGTETAQVEPGVRQTGAPTDPLADFVSVVLGDTEDVWTAEFAARGQKYPPPTLALFDNQINSGCGFAESVVGPFYCPSDQKLYIDLTFFHQLDAMGGAGDFAKAYVVAHEVGHHVQNLLGTAEDVQRQREAASEQESNALSVRMELQADCYAGVWANGANKARQVIEQGDVEEALNAAAAVGDDTLQKRSRGSVVPDSFTHGTSQQRQHWFQQGLTQGTLEGCDTFRAREL